MCRHENGVSWDNQCSKITCDGCGKELFVAYDESIINGDETQHWNLIAT